MGGGAFRASRGSDRQAAGEPPPSTSAGSPPRSRAQREQEQADEAYARQLMMEEMAGVGLPPGRLPSMGGAQRQRFPMQGAAMQSARAECPFCHVENEYTASPGQGPVPLQCGQCRRQFQAFVPEAAGSSGSGAASGTSLHVCRRCGTMNQFPTPGPGAPPPNVQCGNCGAVSSTLQRSRRSGAQARLAEQLLLSSRPGGPGSGPMVRINIGGQRRMVPLALLVALMAEERSNSANERDIQALPTRRLEGGETLGEQNKCLICLEEFADGDDIKTLPCLHIYHQKCVERWLHTDNSCPVCKTPIGDAPSGGSPSRGARQPRHA